MNTLPPPARPDNSAPAPHSNARVVGDIRQPILLACDANHAAWRRLHVAQTEAACGNPDPAELGAAAADKAAAELAFVYGKSDMGELALALLRTVEADPSRGGAACDAVSRMAGVPGLERLIVYLARRIDAAEAQVQAYADRVAELEDAVGRLNWEHSDRGESAGRLAVTA